MSDGNAGMVEELRQKLKEIEYLARHSGQTFIADLIGEVIAEIATEGIARASTETNDGR